MKVIKVNNYEIPYQIAKKRNKNTYFYFKQDGYIQINLSKYQTEKDVVDYIVKNKEKFIAKLTKTTTTNQVKENQIMYRGVIYNVIKWEDNKIMFNEINNTVHTPTTDIKYPLIKSFYKQTMLEQLRQLHKKYKDNPYVTIDGVTYKTRYTTSRHGSCNITKRNININLHLIKYDDIYTEYVFLHEIAHLKYRNHGKEFYHLLEKLCPNYKEIRSNLRKIYR